MSSRCNALGGRSFISVEYSIPAALMQGEVSPPRIRLPGSEPVHFAEPKADNGRDPARSPLPFQSDCKSRRWTGLRQEYWQRANSFCPSQKALCCVQHGCCLVPVYRLPDSAPDTATAPAGNAMPCQGQISVRFWAKSHLPMPTERLKPAFPVPGAGYIVLPVSVLQEILPIGTIWCNSIHQSLPEIPFCPL